MSQSYCMIQERSFPQRNALAVGATVMLLTNIVPEYDLKNGSVGIIREIVYEHKEGSTKDPTIHPEYVLVEFPECKIPQEKALIDGKPKLVPIPPFEMRCEKQCCSECTIPLRVCKAISSYKSQGISVGEGEIYEKAVIGIPSQGAKKTPGLEQMVFARAKEYKDFAIIEDEPLSREQFLKIGQGEATNMRIAFVERLKKLMNETCEPIISKLEEMGDGDFDKGYDILVQKYREAIGDDPMDVNN